MKPPVFRISRQKEWNFTGTGKTLFAGEITGKM
jgi:hypothetical protein